jgi:membrane protein implicated in regulation of membrane protease activity
MMSMGTIYLILVGSSFLLLLVMLLTGLGHHDATGADHDISQGLHGGHDMHIEHGHDGAFHGAELHGGDATLAEGPGILGLRLILAFILGFGGAGYIAWHYGWTFVPHWLLGIAGGLVTYFIVYQILKLLYRQQANTLVNTSRMLNTQGIVTSEILPGSVGEVKLTDPKTGQVHYMRAMANEQGTDIKKGQKVTVVSVTGGLAKVQQ